MSGFQAKRNKKLVSQLSLTDVEFLFKPRNGYTFCLFSVSNSIVISFKKNRLVSLTKNKKEIIICIIFFNNIIESHQEQFL